MEFAHIFTLSVSVVTAINILLAGILIFIERRDIGYTWAWLLILFFIPIVGFIVYLFFGRQLKQKNFYKLSSDEREYLRSSVDEQLKELKATHEYRNDLLIQHN
ncbi:PLDc N-terminal domain-containing protein, partial [Priestia megaterium]|uniref:PLDc N-terminal domain-containing protein n=1 Tax=Priestia megaterium TaxID=1404 RepID=UPI00300903E7